MNILNFLFLEISILFVSLLISLIIEVLLNYFNLDIHNKKFYLVPTLVIAMVINISLFYSRSKDNMIKNYIYNSTSIEELKELIEEKEIFGDILRRIKWI